MWKGKSLVKNSIYYTNYFTMIIVNFSCFWIRGEGPAGAGCKTVLKKMVCNKFYHSENLHLKGLFGLRGKEGEKKRVE